ncbi:hypothetical protein E2C01_078239 [Portunus trituberculatus]|uniref:Uncharacterized protein n=1 Tax=Portunus trituberculatus TaxID=210409 RepID=A0A5B7IPN5_PORTR|nr:hypothetical protein [Portunus trituberculatus]
MQLDTMNGARTERRLAKVEDEEKERKVKTKFRKKGGSEESQKEVRRSDKRNERPPDKLLKLRYRPSHKSCLCGMLLLLLRASSTRRQGGKLRLTTR